LAYFKLNLAGRTALITGGTKGIGRAIADLMAAEGCNLHLAARNRTELEKVQRELSNTYGGTVNIHPADLSVSEEISALAEACQGLDILVNNAGAIPAWATFAVSTSPLGGNAGISKCSVTLT
jgi:short-subunit dehydrogenase